MLVNYTTEGFETFAQYCRAQAGFYPDFCRRTRREAEMAAYAAGVQQRTRLEWAREFVANFDPLAYGRPVPTLAEAFRWFS